VKNGIPVLQGGPRSPAHPICGLLDRRGDYASANVHSEIIHLDVYGEPMKVIERLTAAEIQLRSEGHRCRMKRPSTARILPVFRRAPPVPCRRTNRLFPLPQTLSSPHLFAPASSQAPGVVCRALPHSPGVPSQHPSAPFNSHRARVRRNHERLPSNGCNRKRARASCSRPPLR
jgi:hypothetical protein